MCSTFLWSLLEFEAFLGRCPSFGPLNSVCFGLRRPGALYKYFDFDASYRGLQSNICRRISPAFCRYLLQSIVYCRGRSVNQSKIGMK